MEHFVETLTLVTSPPPPTHTPSLTRLENFLSLFSSSDIVCEFLNLFIVNLVISHTELCHNFFFCSRVQRSTLSAHANRTSRDVMRALLSPIKGMFFSIIIIAVVIYVQLQVNMFLTLRFFVFKNCGVFLSGCFVII